MARPRPLPIGECLPLGCRLNGSTQHRRQISLLGFQIARSHVVVRLADEPLCSDGLANAPTSRCPEESTVSAGHWCSRSIRAATGFADRKNRRRCWSARTADRPPNGRAPLDLQPPPVADGLRRHPSYAPVYRHSDQSAWSDASSASIEDGEAALS